MVNTFDRRALRTAIIQSVITGNYMPIDHDYSVRLVRSDHRIDTKIIDHGALTVKAEAFAATGELTHDVLTAIVDELLEKTKKYEASDYNIGGINTYGDLLRQLQEGLRFGRVETYRDGTQHIDVVLSADRRYIRWRNYGSSANDTTVKDMQFVIEKIFRTDLASFIREYIWLY